MAIAYPRSGHTPARRARWRGWAARRVHPHGALSPHDSARRLALAGRGDGHPTPAGASSSHGAMGDLSLGEFEAFFHYYECDIFSYLARMTGDEAAAYDLSQETFIRAWRSFDKIRGYNQPRAWLFRVASNLALNHLRQRRGALGGATSLEHMIDPASSDPAWRLAERDAVRATLLDLAPRQRAALVLREVYGLSCVEVGQTLGISTAAAKMALLRARVTFKARYQRADASDIRPGPRS